MAGNGARRRHGRVGSSPLVGRTVSPYPMSPFLTPLPRICAVTTGELVHAAPLGCVVAPIGVRTNGAESVGRQGESQSVQHHCTGQLTEQVSGH